METIEERFWSKVDKNAPNGCWLWTAGKARGYGYFRIRTKKNKVRAHRMAWELTYGPIPEGMNVLHSCDNPPCCNPAHLFLGTQVDNVRDMMRKKRDGAFSYTRRDNRGEKSANAKLNNVVIKKLKKIYAVGGVSYAQLARGLGVNETTISRAIRRLTYR